MLHRAGSSDNASTLSGMCIGPMCYVCALHDAIRVNPRSFRFFICALHDTTPFTLPSLSLFVMLHVSYILALLRQMPRQHLWTPWLFRASHLPLQPQPWLILLWYRSPSMIARPACWRRKHEPEHSGRPRISRLSMCCQSRLRLLLVLMWQVRPHAHHSLKLWHNHIRGWRLYITLSQLLLLRISSHPRSHRHVRVPFQSTLYHLSHYLCLAPSHHRPHHCLYWGMFPSRHRLRPRP